MAETNEPATETFVERWLHDQQQWQRTLFTYLDSMMKNDEFVMHLGNAMRGSLLAGKPYPTASMPDKPAPDPATTERLDQVLFALHQLQGQMQDVLLAIDELRSARTPSAGSQTSRRAATTRNKKRRTRP